MSFWTPKAVNDGRYTLSASQELCVGAKPHEFLMGGVAMAAAVDALEHTTGKPLLWATIQFVSHGLLGNELEINTEILGGGRNIKQARASIRHGGELLQSVSAALGRRDSEVEETFLTAPDAPPPLDCPLRPQDPMANSDNLMAQFERRIAMKSDDTGEEWMWIRPTQEMPFSAGLISLISDFFLGAHTKTHRGTSLDNTIRMFARPQTEWILCRTQMSGFKHGVAHGMQHHFSENGELIAISSQTGLLPR